MKPADFNKKFEPALVSAAWDWIYRLRQDDVSQAELAEWFAWYDADPRHQAAFDDMQSFIQQVDRVTEGPDALAPALWLGELAAPGRPALRRKALALWSRATRRPRWAKAAAAAAVLAAVIVPVAGLGPARLLSPRDPPAVYAAAEQTHDAYLADGSRVELAARTSVSVEMDHKRRTVTMQDGIAFFQVAKDASKPFTVNVGKIRVRAVGTAFNIRSAGERVVVTVAEGTVDVYSEGKDARGAVRAHAGTEVAWLARARGPAVAAVAPERALGWKQGHLDYFNEPLAAVVSDLNHFSSRPIVIRGTAVAEIAVTGTIRTDAIQSWVDALPTLFAVSLTTDGKGNIVISDRDLKPRGFWFGDP